MGNLKESLKQTAKDNPELLIQGLECLISHIPEATREKIGNNIANFCRSIKEQFVPTYSFSRSLPNRYQEAIPEIDYGSQLEDYLPIVAAIYEQTKENLLLWEEGQKEFSYVAIRASEDEKLTCSVSLENNNNVMFELNIKGIGTGYNSFCIGKRRAPVHPTLNKACSDLFFLVEDNVLRAKRLPKNKQKEPEKLLPERNEKIISFISKIAELTESNRVTWKKKESTDNRYICHINKKDGSTIAVALTCRSNEFTEMIAVQKNNDKLKKLFIINNASNSVHVEMQAHIKSLYKMIA